MRTFLGTILPLLTTACIGSNGGSFYIGQSQGSTWIYNGETFRQDLGFGFFRVSNNSVYGLAQDTLSISAYSDSSCTTPATGTFSVTRSSATTQSGSATFGNIAYTWPTANREGDFYVRAYASGYGVSTCGGPYLVTQHFTGGSCFTTGCAGPGIKGSTGSSLNEQAYRIFFGDQGMITAIGQVRVNGLASGQRAQAIWRFNPDGTKDTTYGNLSGAYSPAGTTSVAGGTAGNFSDKFWDATLDSSSRIVIAGESWNGSGAAKMTVWRFTSAAAQDTTFSGGNYYFVHPTSVTGGGFDQARAVIVDSQGRYVIAGSSENASLGVQSAIWRVTSSGAADTTFNNANGSHTYGVPGIAGASTAATVADGMYALAEDSQGRYIAVGESKNTSGGRQLAFLRYLSDGTLDTTFGGGTGAVTLSSSVTGATAAGMWDTARTLKIDSQGRYIVGGASKNSSGGYQLFVGRFNTDGSVDTTFGASGFFIQGAPNPMGATTAGGLYGWTHRIVLGSDQSIYVGGYDQDSGGWKRGIIYKLTTSGQLDTSFGAGNGYVMTVLGKPSGSSGHFAYGLDIDRVGRLLLSGQAYNGSGSDMAIWRFQPDGTLDE